MGDDFTGLLFKANLLIGRLVSGEIHVAHELATVVDALGAVAGETAGLVGDPPPVKEDPINLENLSVRPREGPMLLKPASGVAPIGSPSREK